MIGCHTTKQAAIDQMVAVSIAEDMEPGGERSEQRAVDLPRYMRQAASRGLELRAEGYGGDGLTDKTIREARDIAAGTMSDDKVIRANAWGARHAVDLEASKNSNPDDEEWPGAGAVAHYLWGIDPLDPEPARDWLARNAERITNERHSMPTKIETRELHVPDMEVRSLDDGRREFVGYAAVFNSDSEPLPFIERIQPGAFQQTLASRNNVKMFVNHDDTQVLATTRSGTLRLSEDAKGLRVEATLPDTTAGRDLATLLEARIVDSMSFGFSIPPGGDSWSSDGQTRTLESIRLHEVSVVTGWPAYAATEAGVRKIQHLIERTAADNETLIDALSAFEAGNDLTADQADTLRAAIDALTPIADAAPNDLSAVDILRKKLELEAKKF